MCELIGAALVVAKLDRLSRDVAFLAALQDSGARFVAADMPEANELTIHIMAAVAQAERKAISRRTIEALAAAKARGVALGIQGATPTIYGKGLPQVRLFGERLHQIEQQRSAARSSIFVAPAHHPSVRSRKG